MNRARLLFVVWITAILALFALHGVHLLADFPNNSPWMDYSKYTDEGWYGSAAVRYHLTGHWFLRGDFNPAVALPVWPLLLAAVFHFTGVSLLAARALVLGVFAVNLFLTYLVVCTQAARWTALLAVTLLVSNPFLFAFSRLAILEPLVMGILLLSWLLALRLPRASHRAQFPLLIAIGLLLCLLVLTKTTALFILPSTLSLIACAYGFRLRPCLRAAVVAITAALIPWCAWYFLLIRPRYRVDYQYLFDANKWPQPTTPGGWIAAFWYALHGALWISPVLCITAAALFLLALIPARSTSTAGASHFGPLARNPLTLASLLTAGGYIFFTGWHNNPQPRYYETVIYPLCFLLALSAADLLRHPRPLLLRAAGAASLVLMAGVSVFGTVQIMGYLRHPEYAWIDAATGITRYIDEHPGPHRLLLSISGANIELATHLPAICDDYGTWDLPYRIHVYQPGWYAAWNDLDPGTLADIQTQDSLERVAVFPAFDDPDRNLLVLYRLHPLPPSKQKYPAAEENEENARK